MEENLIEQERSRIIEVEKARVADNSRLADFSIAEPALPPAKPINPRAFLNIGLALVLGVISGLGAAILSEYLKPTFDSPGDVELHLGLSVLASITRTRP
jgi:capsular polysaccharide biosynthesis protein